MDEEQNYRRHIEEILDDWDSAQSGRNEFKMGRPNYLTNEGQFAIVYAYCAHVHATARAYLAALDAAPALVATPLARAAYEMAVTAHWIAQTPDGYRALNNEEIRSRINLAQSFRESTNEVFHEGASAVTHADWSLKLDSDSDAAARNFSHLCDDLTPAGRDAYAIYRAMSMECHPTVLIADQWVTAPKDDGARMTLRRQPIQPSSEDAWPYLVAGSLIWSGRALDFFDRGHVRRSFLRRKAREVGVAEVLKLSQTYRDRVRAAKRARKASQGITG